VTDRYPAPRPTSEPDGGSRAVAFLRRLGCLCPGSADASDELDRALSFLGWSIPADAVVEAGYGAGLVAAVAVVPLVAFVPASFRIAAVPGLVAVCLGTIHTVHRGPVALAAVRRTNALGEAPGIVARTVLRMRITPTVESATAFGARSGRGPLSASLARHVDRAAGTPRSGLSGFADEWEEWFPALQRSAGLVVAAAEAPAGERARTLDRALTAVLDGTRDRMADFAGTVRGPAMALYAFGVLLPLALIAVLPAARAAGVPVSLPVVVVAYDLFLPAIVTATTVWLLVRRPVAFPPPDVDRTHPDVSGGRLGPVLVGVGVAAAAVVCLSLAMPAWTAPVGAIGGGLGAGLVARYRPIAAVRSRVRAVESGLSDALYLVGRRVAEGEAVETAVERAAEELPGETGEILGEASAVGRRLQVDVRESFLGEHGALADVPSPRIRGAAELLSAAADEGRPAGPAVVAMADHLDELESVEQAARRELSRVTGTLQSTAAVFGPLVAGATVALSRGVAVELPSAGVATGSNPALGATGTAGSAMSPAALGTAVGAYVLFLAAVLTVLSVGLERGLDPALVGYRLGRTLCSATAVFLSTVFLVGQLV